MEYFEAIQISYNNNLEIVPVSGVVRSHFKIKNEFKFTHESGAEIKREFFVPYVRRYQQNLILVVSESNIPHPEEESINTAAEFVNKPDQIRNEIPCANISELVPPTNTIGIFNKNHAVIAFCNENENQNNSFDPNTNDYPIIDCREIEDDSDAPPPKIVRTISCVGEIDFLNFPKNNAINNDKYNVEDLRTLITRSVPEVISKYNKNPASLNNNDRIKVSKTIINNILDNNPETVLKRENFDQLADKILNIFNQNTECKSVYYTPAEKGRSARGKLFDAYYNKKNILSQGGVITRRKLTSKCVPEYEITSTTQSLETDESELISNSIEFLKKNVTPWQEIIEHWKNTHTRRALLLSSKISTHDYINQFLCLLELKGLELIEIDANLRYPDIRPFSDDEFRIIAEKIITKAEGFKSPIVKKYLDILTDENLKSKEAICLLLLPHLTSTYFVAGKKKPSKLEVQETFIQHFESEAEAEKAKPAFKQPRILLLGSLINPTAAISLADKTIYTENLLSAFKSCFNIFCGLNISYPAESNHIWVLVEQVFFNVNISKIILPNIELLIKSLKSPEYRNT